MLVPVESQNKNNDSDLLISLHDTHSFKRTINNFAEVYIAVQEFDSRGVLSVRN